MLETALAIVDRKFPLLPGRMGDRVPTLRWHATSDPAELPAGAVQVWLCRPVERGSMAMDQLYALLSPPEQERSQAFNFNRDKELYVTGHGVARLALAQVTGEHPENVGVNAAPGQRPSLADAQLDLSISHTDGLVAVGVAREVRCGVDVEVVGRRIFRSESVLAPSELAELTGNEERYAFYRYWTLKEAISKVSGQGLSMDFAAVELNRLDCQPEIVRGHTAIDLSGSGEGWMLAHRFLGGETESEVEYSVSVATHGQKSPQVRPLWSWTEALT